MGASCMLTIGMPVFDGERYIGAAIESILRQTFEDFKLIVLDNASTDGTAAIVQGYAERDGRVQYRRNERNIGAGPNFNRVFSMCDSPYFKWAACDDEIEPTYLERCIGRLQADPAVVLAHSYVRQIDEHGHAISADLPEICPDYFVQMDGDASVFRPMPPELEDPDPLIRFRSNVVTRGLCTEIFGVIRAAQLRGTIMHASFVGSDRLLLCELALRGRFSVVPEPLFKSRDHPERYVRRVFIPAQRAEGRERVLQWYDPSKTGRNRQLNWWIFFFNYFTIIKRNVAGRIVRVRFYLVAATWLTSKWNRFDLIKDLLFALDPRALVWVTRQFHRLKKGRVHVA